MDAKIVTLDRVYLCNRELVKNFFELYQSIRDRGMVMPITVRPVPRTGILWFLKRQRYEILDGASRFFIAHMLRLKTVPIWIAHVTDAQLLEARIISGR